MPRTDLDHEDGNGDAGSTPDRGGVGLGKSEILPEGQEPGEMERPSGQDAARARQGDEGEAFRGYSI